MGRERWEKRQYFYFCLAAVIVVGLAACRHVPTVDRPLEDRWEHLQPVQTFIENRDFEGAAARYQKIISEPCSIHCDLAMFDLGLVYSHYANPRRDYKKSLSWFNRVLKDYPRSPLVEETKMWINLLEMLEKTQRVDIELEEKKIIMNEGRSHDVTQTPGSR